jgi:hypothetical protein
MLLRQPFEMQPIDCISEYLGYWPGWVTSMIECGRADLLAEVARVQPVIMADLSERA